MANLAKLPSGQYLIATKVASGSFGSAVAYGPQRLNVTVATSPLGHVAVLRDSAQQELAKVTDRGTIWVTLKALTPLTVPYVNLFLAGTGRTVIKNWRTDAYRIKVAKNTNPVGAPEAQPSPAAQHTAAVSDETEERENEAAMVTSSPSGEGKGAVITISGEERNALSGIPGIRFYERKPLKGAGRGYTNVDGVLLRNEHLSVLNAAWNLRQQGKPAATLITGPAGTAKTMLVRAFAASLGVPYLKVDAGAVRTADDWAGTFRQDPSTKTWAHRWSPFAQVLRTGAPCIIHIDELTRTESPAALNAFMGLLDETGTLLVPDANAVLTMPKGILVVATANIGPEFVGTLPLDGAVRQRFPYGIRMAPPAEASEAKLLSDRTGIDNDTATRLVRMAVEQRKHRDDAQLYPSGAIISTRVLLSIAELIGNENVPVRDAVISTLEAQFDPGDDAALSVLVDSQFPKGWKPGQTEAQPTVDATIITEKHYFSGRYRLNANGDVACDWMLTDGSQCNTNQNSPIHLR
jgi:MoxR-like ATPase